jgi:exopolysaccharide biosynthesis polyprenyl glycosylphosphotransferase
MQSFFFQFVFFDSSGGKKSTFGQLLYATNINFLPFTIIRLYISLLLLIAISMSNQATIIHKRWISYVFGTIDIFATLITLLGASWITKNYTTQIVEFDREFVLVSLIVTIIWVILLKSTHLARIPRTSAIPILLSDFIKLSIIGGSIILFLDWVIVFDNFPSFALALFIILNFFTLFIIRLFTFKFFKHFRANGHNTRNIVIIADDNSDNLIDKILNQKEWGFKILHIITDSKKIKDKYCNQVKIYPKTANIKSLIRFDIVDEVICCDCLVSEKRFYELIDFCYGLGVIVRIQGNQKYTGEYKSRIQYFDRMPFLTIENSPMNSFEYVVKTLTEIFIAFIILFLLSPLLMLISVLIVASSKGPVIFKQERVGLRGRKFYIYKFRTMVQNAEALKVLLLEQNESDGPTFKIKKDPRITFIGRILRKTNLDEIPQLFNVIQGEMSIIGPRPPLSSEVEKYEEWQLKRLAVKPGLTCTWQIVPNRNDVKFEKWMKMDIHYIENWSLRSDIELFFKTFKTVLFARGA